MFELIGGILLIILYVLYLCVMTFGLCAIGFVTAVIGVGRGMVKGINKALDIYFSSLIRAIKEGR